MSAAPRRGSLSRRVAAAMGCEVLLGGRQQLLSLAGCSGSHVSAQFDTHGRVRVGVRASKTNADGAREDYRLPGGRVRGGHRRAAQDLRAGRRRTLRAALRTPDQPAAAGPRQGGRSRRRLALRPPGGWPPSSSAAAPRPPPSSRPAAVGRQVQRLRRLRGAVVTAGIVGPPHDPRALRGVKVGHSRSAAISASGIILDSETQSRVMSGRAGLSSRSSPCLSAKGARQSGRGTLPG